MSLSRSSRRGVALLTVVLLLAVAGGIASVVLWRHGIRSRIERDRRAAARWAAIRIDSRLPDPRLSSAVTVGVLAEPASDRWFNGPATRDTITGAWVSALRELGADAKVVAPGDVDALRRVAVLVVPSAPCLGAAGRNAVESVLARGGGVLASWLTGTRDGSCGDAGYAFITRLSQATHVDTLDSRRITAVTFPDGGVLAADIPPGATFQVRSAHDAAARRIGRDAYYSDGFLNPSGASDQPGLDAAVTHAAIGGGRAVYWGFDLSRVVDRPWDRSVSRLLLRNSVAWAAGNPLVSLAPWPNGRDAAVVVVQDVDDSVGSAGRIADTLQRAGVRATFLLATNAVHDLRDIAPRLASNAEIASRPDDELRIARTEEEQTEKFRGMRGELAGIVGREVSGMMPPMERIDPLLALSWARAGGTYFVAGNGVHSASPEILSVDGSPLVLLPRVADDDAAALRRGGAPELDARNNAALAKLRALGGLYLMRHHTSLSARADVAASLVRTARLVGADSTLWVATANDVAAWWTARSHVAVSATGAERDALTIRVANDGAAPVDGAVLRVALGAGRQVASVSGAALLAPRAGAGDETVALRLPPLAPKSVHTVALRLAAESAHAR